MGAILPIVGAILSYTENVSYIERHAPCTSMSNGAVGVRGRGVRTREMESL